MKNTSRLQFSTGAQSYEVTVVHKHDKSHRLLFAGAGLAWGPVHLQRGHAGLEQHHVGLPGVEHDIHLHQLSTVRC